MEEYILKYGTNPHQKLGKIYSKKEKLPFKILNGNPGYINFLDAFNSWQLVKELRLSLNLPAATSFKHVSPAGVGVGVELSDSLRKAYFIDDLELSPVATAYARARGGDRMSSFGDWVAISDIVDLSTAKVLKRSVSDGIIAPGYTVEALELLKAKKKGKYCIIEIDFDYEPEVIERREVYGITFEQNRNNVLINEDILRCVLSNNKEIPKNTKRDLIIAMTTLKYTQSNSVCYAFDGQIIGCGAGQQSRIHCTRLAGEKADIWYLRQHPKVLNLTFKKGISYPSIDNAIDQFLRDDVTEKEKENWNSIFEEVPIQLTKEEKLEWISTLKGVSLGSDGFFPFRDNIDRANKSGVEFIVQPYGSVNDEFVLNACNEYGIVMIHSRIRLFHH